MSLTDETLDGAFEFMREHLSADWARVDAVLSEAPLMALERSMLDDPSPLGDALAERLAHRLSDGNLKGRPRPRWAAERVDVAERTGDERLSTIGGLWLAAWAQPTLERSLATLPPDAQPAGVPGPLGPVLDRPERIFCVGRKTTVDHREELGNVASSWPEVFLRFGSSVIGPFDDVRRPSVVQRLDYEGELAVIIGRGGRHIAAGDALDHVFGYTAANDLTARDWQGRGRQWTSGKNFDGTLPIGPHIVTADELNGEDAVLTTRLNGEVMQKARTSQFIFGLGEQIEFLSSIHGAATGRSAPDRDAGRRGRGPRPSGAPRRRRCRRGRDRGHRQRSWNRVLDDGLTAAARSMAGARRGGQAATPGAISRETVSAGPTAARQRQPSACRRTMKRSEDRILTSHTGSVHLPPREDRTQPAVPARSRRRSRRPSARSVDQADRGRSRT